MHLPKKIFQRLALAALMLSPFAHATEGGQTRVLPGLPGQDLALPLAPGWYGTVNQLHYSADRLNDDSGNIPVVATGVPGITANANVKYKTDVTAFILIYKSEKQLAGGDLGMLVVLPYISGKRTVNLSGNFPAGLPVPVVSAISGGLAQKSAALSGESSGLSDLQVSPFIDWQSDQSRTLAGIEVIAPTGSYDENRAFNPGFGRFWSYRPVLAYSYSFERGIDLVVRADYTVNTRNKATQVKSGQYLHADWAAMYRINEDYKIGLHGYVIKQLTGDDGPGVSPTGDKVQVYAAGPGISYIAPSLGWGLEAKWLKEFAVKNRTEGNAIWIRGQYRFE